MSLNNTPICYCPFTDKQIIRLIYASSYMADLAYEIVKEEAIGKDCIHKWKKLKTGILIIERLRKSCNFTDQGVNDLLEIVEELYVGPYDDRALDIQDDNVIDI